METERTCELTFGLALLARRPLLLVPLEHEDPLQTPLEQDLGLKIDLVPLLFGEATLLGLALACLGGDGQVLPTDGLQVRHQRRDVVVLQRQDASVSQCRIKCDERWA